VQQDYVRAIRNGMSQDMEWAGQQRGRQSKARLVIAVPGDVTPAAGPAGRPTRIPAGIETSLGPRIN